MAGTLKRKWIQKAAGRFSANGRHHVKAGSVREIVRTGSIIRSQIRYNRLPYATGIRRLVFAHNALKANPNIPESDRRVRALRSQIERTKMLRR